jgi:hypothetical protein
MSAVPTFDGGVFVEGSGDDLTFRKTVRGDGTFTLDIASSADHVVIEATAFEVTVARNGRQLSLTPAASGDDELEVARLLADSRAVKRLRLAGASTLESEDMSPAAAALLLSDAMVGMLTGDYGAPSRIGRHLTRGLRSRLRKVGPDDCYYTWERRVVAAMNELEDCVEEGGAWSSVIRMACSARWYLMVESYWVSFLTCSGWKF